MKSATAAAGFGPRLLAWLLDLMLLVALGLPIMYLVNTFAAALLATPGAWSVYTLLRDLLVVAVCIIGLGWATARFGASPGKLLMDLQVVDAESQHWLTPQRAMLRILLSLGSMFSLVGVLMMIFDEGERRTFHDWFLRTRVIPRGDESARETLPGAWR